MQPFTYVETETAEAAVKAVSGASGAEFFAGGTTLLDLMKLNVMAPASLIDINHLPFTSIEASHDRVSIGANVRNSDLAHHSLIRKEFPALSEALLAGASAQLRNMATTGGNLMQRTRCNYFRDHAAHCNKRNPGSGCDALQGFNRSHAILGGSEHCIATHPSDMCIALIILEATVETLRPNGEARTIPIVDFHLLPGGTPQLETILQHGELITHIHLPLSPLARQSHYLKVRDRASYEFALASAAVAITLDGEWIREARVGMGGIATRPWRSLEAEAALKGKRPGRESWLAAADAALAGAKPLHHNGFKIELSRQTLILALEQLAKGKSN